MCMKYWLMALLIIGARGPLAYSQNAADKSGAAKEKPVASAVQFDAEFCDDGHLRLALEVDRLEFETPYGTLAIPVSEVRQVELALRLSDAEQKRIDAAIFSLGSSDFNQRNEGSQTLLGLGAKAYPAVLKAARHADLEVAHRAQEMAVKLRETLTEEQLVPREFDIIETEHSRIAGTIAAKQLAVITTQFGKQQLALIDVRTLVAIHAPRAPVDPIDVQPDPGNLLSFHGLIGKTLAFKVTGRGDGSVYGTGIYTTDSNLATAAVHAGVLKAGETGIVRIAMIASPPTFTSSTQNGISSNGWGVYPAAYQVIVPKKK